MIEQIQARLEAAMQQLKRELIAAGHDVDSGRVVFAVEWDYGKIVVTRLPVEKRKKAVPPLPPEKEI